MRRFYKCMDLNQTRSQEVMQMNNANRLAVFGNKHLHDLGGTARHAAQRVGRQILRPRRFRIAGHDVSDGFGHHWSYDGEYHRL